MNDPWKSQMAALGSFIRTQRKLADLSLRELAEMTDVSNPVSYTHLTLPTILRV